MLSRIGRLVTFEVRKLLARRLALATLVLVAVVAALSPLAGRVVDTATALSKGRAAVADPFKNGWTTLAGGIGAALPFAVIALLVFAGSSVSEESQHGTLKSILARPVRRTEWLLAKLLALVLFASALVVAMSGAAALVAWREHGFGNIVDPDNPGYVYGDLSRAIPSYTFQAIALLVPSLVAVVAWALLWSVTIDHPGYSVGAAIGGFLLLAVAAGLSDRVGPALFVTWVGRPISTFSEVGEAISGAQTRFKVDRLPSIVVPLASALVFTIGSAFKLARRDIAE